MVEQLNDLSKGHNYTESLEQIQTILTELSILESWKMIVNLHNNLVKHSKSYTSYMSANTVYMYIKSIYHTIL